MTDKEYTLKYTLIDMMFASRPLEEFERLWNSEEAYEWSELLHMCYCEESCARVGGDEGYLENPPIPYEQLAYLQELIAFLEEKGIKENHGF